jgi:isopentenyl diphosphate isomerase/L-lactate dehydrogenase-like FMN-dependent dehydrogenase
VGMAIDVLASEVKRTLQLLGCKSIKDIKRKHIRLNKSFTENLD